MPLRAQFFVPVNPFKCHVDATDQISPHHGLVNRFAAKTFCSIRRRSDGEKSEAFRAFIIFEARMDANIFFVSLNISATKN